MLGLALGLLIYEGELLQVLQGLDVGRRDAGLVEGALVPDGVLVGVGHHLLQTLQLHGFQLGPRHALDLGIVVLLIVRDVLLRHHCSLFPFPEGRRNGLALCFAWVSMMPEATAPSKGKTHTE